MTGAAVDAIPPLVKLAPETKDVVLGAIKLVLKRLKTAGLVEDGVEYGDLAGQPRHMAAFIARFKNNRRVAKDLALTRAGQPARRDDEELVCGLTLAQIERLLVYTCAKKAMARGARLHEDEKAVIAFDWQLPLLGLYGRMTVEHFQVLGDDLLVVRSAEGARALATLTPAQIERAREVAGERFGQMLAEAPEAIRGVARCDADVFDLLVRVAGPRLWEFLAGDEQRVVEIGGVSPERVTALGPDVADLCVPSLRQIEHVPTEVLRAFLSAFRAVFGPAAAALLADQEFAFAFLRDAANQARGLAGREGVPEAQVEDALRAAWESVKPRVETWLADRSPPADGATETE